MCCRLISRTIHELWLGAISTYVGNVYKIKIGKSVNVTKIFVKDISKVRKKRRDKPRAETSVKVK